MADKKNQMSEKQLDKVSGGVVKQYVLDENEFNEYQTLKRKDRPLPPTPDDNVVPEPGTDAYIEYMKNLY